VELVAQALDVLFIQLSLAAQDFQDDAKRPEDAHKIFLPQAMLIHQEAQNVFTKRVALDRKKNMSEIHILELTPPWKSKETGNRFAHVEVEVTV